MSIAREEPASAEAVAEVLSARASVRPVGGGTKLGWGAPGGAPEIELSTARLDRLLEHNEADLTAVLEAGVRFADAQATFARAGQRLSLDPPGDDRATVGGVVASGDSGPLRHRYGGIRDLILGLRVALPDGTVARAGSRVIKNVAGYDLAKLMCGAFGTLGVVCEVTVRLHPLPAESATAVGRSLDPARLVAGAATLRDAPFGLDALDLRWDGPAGGGLLARATGHGAERQAERAAELMAGAGLAPEMVEDAEAIWAEQQARQRASNGGAVVRVSATPSQLGRLLDCTQHATVRAGVGLAWVRIDADPESLARLRSCLEPARCVLLDAPEEMRAAVDPWGPLDEAQLELMRRVKERFDPHSVCNPGRFVGGL